MKLPYIILKNQPIIPFNSISTETKIGKQRSLNALKAAMTNDKSKNNQIVILFQMKDYKNTKEIKPGVHVAKYGVIVTIDSVVPKNANNFDYQLVTLNGALPVELVKIYQDSDDDDNNIMAEVKSISINKTDDEVRELFTAAQKLTKMIIKISSNKDSKGNASVKSFIEDFSALQSTKPDLHKDFYSLTANDFVSLSPKKKESIIDTLTKFAWYVLKTAYVNEVFQEESIIDFINSYDVLKIFTKTISQIEMAFKMDDIEEEINETFKKQMDEQQREFYLREKMRVIKKMLKDDVDDQDMNEFSENDLNKLQYPSYVLEAIKTQQARLSSMMPSSPDANIIRTYVELLLKLPWRKVSKEIIEINNVRKVLDKHHYGLEKPKERILEFLSVLTHTKKKNEKEEYVPIKGDKNHFIDSKLFIEKGEHKEVQKAVNNIPILTLIGPPGVGKTTLAKSIAEALDREFVKISLGGVSDEADVRGHRRTYVGALPGKIIEAIKKAGVSNPVILLDEIDKMTKSYKGDPISAMLEVLDPEQNIAFEDHYLDMEYDLSKVLFIATANYYEDIPAPLIDRVELLELSTYTTIEKVVIAKTHLLPKILLQNQLTKDQLQISDKVLEFIVRNYTRESGVRELKRLLDSIARKIVVRILDNKIKNKFIVDEKVVVDFLGPIKFEPEQNENIARIGVTNGLAYTSFGGSTLAIEVTKFSGKEGLKLTGSLKDVMKESAQIALAYVRANANKFDIDFDFENNSIHIHVPEGAVPKDGPSAGVTFTTSIISALSNKPVPANVGMTGEITLRGKVLPIGGLKEKSLAASQFGIKKIFIPFDNKKNLIDVPEEVKKEVEFIPVKYYDEIYQDLFANTPKVKTNTEVKKQNKK